jgi:transcriptional regulator with XRE-family HTH domain
MPKRDKTLTDFGRNVSRFRNDAGLSQDKLAEKADLDRTYLSGIERGVRNPGIKVVIRLARALNVSLDRLCAGILQFKRPARRNESRNPRLDHK